MRPIAILGMGAASPFGHGARALWEGCLGGQRVIRELSSYSTDGMKHVSAALRPPGLPGQANPVATMAVDAAREAIEQARERGSIVQGARLGVFLATAPGEPDELRLIDEEIAGLDAPGHSIASRNLSPEAWATVLGDSVMDTLIRTFRWEDAYCLTISAACASANIAMGVAADALLDGFVDTAVVIAAESIPRLTQAGFSQVGALSPTGVRPFSSERSGTMVGEGAAAFVLARADTLVAAIPAMALLMGFGQSCDALHPVHTEPEGRGIEAATRAALADAGVTPEQVDAVYVHGTGTRQNDLSEARALARVFGERSPVAAGIKSVIGHALGAASGLSAVCGVMTLRTGLVPPTAGVDPLDPECKLSFSNAPRRVDGARVVLNNGYGFGGINSSIVLGDPSALRDGGA